MSSLPGNARNASVFVVGNKPAARAALSRLLQSLGFQALTFSSIRVFLEQVGSALPGCLLLDVFLPGQNASELERVISEDYGRPIIFLANHADIRLAVEAMKAGAVDFLTKPVNCGDLVKAIRSALEKDHHVRLAKAQLSLVMAEFQSFERRLANVSPREREVLQHLLAGERNKEIAFHMGITEKTVKVHRARVMEKMEVSSLADLVRAASERGIGLGLYSPPAAALPTYSHAAAASR